MNVPHIHIMLNHIPVIGVLFCTLLFIISLVLKNTQFQRVTLVLLFLIAISTIPVFLTGEPSEEFIEDIPTVSKSFIEDHEKSAIASLILMEILGGFSLLGLIFSRRSVILPGYIKNVILLICIVTSSLFAYTAYLGGHIRHSEIRSDFKATAPAGNENRLTGENDKN